MNASDILNALRKGAEFVEAIAPVATIAGGPVVGTVAAVISSVSDIADNISNRASEGHIVFSSEDQSEIQAIVARIADANDKLNQAIQQS